MLELAREGYSLKNWETACFPITMGHIIVLMQKIKDDQVREWYAQNTLQSNISRDVLIMQIEQDLCSCQGSRSLKALISILYCQNHNLI